MSKHSLILFFFGIVCSISTNAQSQELLFEELVKAEKEAHSCIAHSSMMLLPNTNYNLKYHRLEWSVDPNVRYIEGIVTSYLVPDIALDTIIFDLRDELTIDSVKYHGTNIVSSDILRANHVLKIALPNPAPASMVDSISIYYQGIPPGTAFGGFKTTKVCGGVNPILATLSEPFSARSWWPCKQDLNDKIDSLDIFITVPKEYTAASNGKFIDTITVGLEKTFHWKHKHLIPAYLISMAVSDYQVNNGTITTSQGILNIQDFVFPCNTAYAANSVPILQEIMPIFDSLFIGYPFFDEKYGHANFDWGGGMEHQTISSMGGSSGGFYHLLIAHELAHQWFGDYVTCGNWQHIWLNEGFATYLEGMTYENNSGPNTWQNWLQSKFNHVLGLTYGSVFVPDVDSTNVGRIFSGRWSYSKGALVLHTLRWKIGDDAFFQGVRNYLLDAQANGGYALTSDLNAALSDESGQNLDEFFADWYYGEGWPTFNMDWVQHCDSTISITINQTQSHPSVSFFDIPVPVRFTGPSGDTLIAFEPTFSGQTMTASLDFIATNAEFNHERQILAGPNSSINQQCKFVRNNFDTGDHSLRNLISCTNDADTILFCPNLENDTIVLNSPLVISKELYIKSNLVNPVYLDGENATYIFRIGLDGNVGLEGLSLIQPLSFSTYSIENKGILYLKNISISSTEPITSKSVINYGSLTIKDLVLIKKN